MCPDCKIRECDQDSEPPGGGYFSTCVTCSNLGGYRAHTHAEYPTQAQVQAGVYREGHTWRTSQTMRPLWEDGRHVGFRCWDRACGFEERFTADDLTPCPDHPGLAVWQCRNHKDHRIQRGEATQPHGYLTDKGRQADAERVNAQVWDPRTGEIGTHRFKYPTDGRK